MAQVAQAPKATQEAQKPRKRSGPIRAMQEAIIRTDPGYRLFLRYMRHAGKPKGRPQAPWYNAVLQTTQEWQAALRQVDALGLPRDEELTKNWDALAALDVILSHTKPDAHVLDGGPELWSPILPWLYLYGYKRLIGINPDFKRKVKRGPILYEPGDITATRFKDEEFDVVTCMSVIEHGVDPQRYLQECTRILKPNGLLITSTDYWADPVDTRGQKAYGVPIHIFTSADVASILNMSGAYGFEPTGPMNLACGEKVIHWDLFDLDYTFCLFTLRKRLPAHWG
jgi:SAM-dependent methyltransferase